MAEDVFTEDEAELKLSPWERQLRPEPQNYQELSPQLDFLYRVQGEFAQWVQFADAKAGGVVLVLSIGALDLLKNAATFLKAYELENLWGYLSMVGFFGGFAAMAFTITGVARALFPKVRKSRPSDMFFGVAATYPTGEAYSEAVMRKRELDIMDTVAVQAWNLACIAHDKYRFLRHAYLGALLFLVGWAFTRVMYSLAT